MGKKNIFYLIPPLIIMLVFFYFLFFPKKSLEILEAGSLNVLLITLDTTRADRIGAYGYAGAKTPNLDSLALKGVKFSNAYCQVPQTLPSHCSILTGTYPLYHHVHSNGFNFLGTEYLTLPELLKSHGFKTAAFISSFTVDSRFGLDQGFDFYDDSISEEEIFKSFHSQRRADKVYESFCGWFNRNSRDRFFCWVHFFDPHLPYAPPSPYKEIFADNPYDGEIAYMDLYIGKIIKRLAEQNLLRKTLIILAGDHGEAFGEKGEREHGLFLYNSTMKVPLIFYAEGILPGGMDIRSNVRLIDIMPSILDILKIEVPDVVQGTTLLPYIKAGKSEDLPTYLETVYPKDFFGWSDLSGLVDGPWKYIRAPKPELYNLIEDPGEEKNLFTSQNKRARLMANKLTKLVKEHLLEIDIKKRRLSSEELKRLRSLGYVGGGLPKDRSNTPLPDPKDKLDEYNLIYEAKMHEYGKKYQEAVLIYREIIDRSPEAPWNYVNLSICYAKMNNLDDCIRVLKQGSERIPGSLILLSRLGLFYMRSTRYKEAFETARQALALDPRCLDALLTCGWSLIMTRKWAESLQYFKKSLEIEPENKSARVKYAYCLGALGRGGEALEIYTDLIEEYPDDYRLYTDVGIIHNSMGNLDQALISYKKAVEIKPFYENFLNYGVILGRKGKFKEAVHYLKLYLQNTSEGSTPRKVKTRQTISLWEKRL
ncbi:MAG: sulfatase-like hydrolase/transferase [Candidatus Aminicenantes bacterium]|nr:sulfatase-like hydrolase/transferase [Candidatus Aminicenantes bacterium]